jgi:hypothetical protein
MTIDGDTATGSLRITVGGVEMQVPTLKIRAAAEWKASIYADRPLRSDLSANPGTWTLANITEFEGLATDVLLDLVVSYDKSAALGGREWLEANADPGEIALAAELMVGAASYFASNPRILLTALVARRVVGVESAAPAESAG